MTLAAIIKEEVLTSLSDDLKKEYKKQSNGTFLLDVTAVDGFALEDVRGLKSALSSERTTRESAENKLKSFEGLDVDKARDAIKKVQEMENWTPEQKVKEQIATIKTQMEEKHRGELTKKEEEVSMLTQQLQKKMIDSEAIKAISENGGSPKSASVLLYPIRELTRMRKTDKGDFVVEVIGTDGNPRISPASGSTSPMSISELVAEMKNNEAYAPLFDGTGATGTGATPSTTTRTGKITNEELGKLPPAERLKKANEMGIKK
jgi:hypothetical protein